MITVSEDVLAKAKRLVHEHRVHPLVNGPHRAVYTVDGDTAHYTVHLWQDGSGYCTCPAQVQCSHFVAAYGVWQGPNRLEELLSA